ncbi:hypothetical protein LEL_07121 [Akanthomyces lecanii RCEF 1005]|uniref:Uncharacterized protein n=1 Tax=Akanthomyces lecanii RCEF 1005 TaxID=1081108 RepID=A0A168FFX8_CORDF|nr:hypothetical protein LEL_07121 [Akanthomyces lecanii RCEF 1005]
MTSEPQPQLPPLPPAQINIFQVDAALRTWRRLFLQIRGHCICGAYEMRGICGHIVHEETVLCGDTRTRSGEAKCCHPELPVHLIKGYLLRMVCEDCYDGP